MRRWTKEWSTKENKGKLQWNHDASTVAAATLSSGKIKPIALVVIELRLYEGISKRARELVSQSVENSTK